MIGADAIVVEIGANDASFYHGEPCRSWVTVDKYGNPDIIADLDGPDTRLPLESGSVDLVICTEVLEHLTMGTPLVREMSRILKPAGVAVISVPNVASLKSRLKVLFGSPPNNAASGDCGHDLGGTGVLIDGNWVAAHVVDFTQRRLVGYLSRGGLRVTEVVKVPIAVSGLRFGRQFFTIPNSFYPSTFSDYLLVKATPVRS